MSNPSWLPSYDADCAAMIVEELPLGRRYRCNDGFADDDFDDIVFRLERV